MSDPAELESHVKDLAKATLKLAELVGQLADPSPGQNDRQRYHIQSEARRVEMELRNLTR